MLDNKILLFVRYLLPSKYVLECMIIYIIHLVIHCFLVEQGKSAEQEQTQSVLLLLKKVH